ncbi:MAG: hypothetical protein GY766_05415 [Herbaspirillum sp.]|uniref:hypothetical protein n=1 Tax=Herbaspirillum sp. TaxID=1890675 RepID=UPI00258D8B5B|nr:hypothetical protein [Herbaspirillum sp.]MCP3654321.1 hypothetical protein [Herbaspirillum sp.]
MYHIKVDSCRLSIPLQFCNILNKDLQDYFIDYRLNVETGEQTEIKTSEGIPFILNSDNGVYVKIWVDSQITFDKKTSKRYAEPYITLLANSKHLGKDYFRGITKDTLKDLYSYFMDLKVFECDFKYFKNARYSDLDIAFDFKCSQTNFAILKDNILKSCLNKTYFNTTNKDNNSGIWTPTKYQPRQQATPKKPYIKFYSKEIDFNTKSFDFANFYNLHDKAKNIVRYECTVKNTAHKKRLGLNKYPTIISLLNSDLQIIIRSIFLEYFIKAKFVKNTKLLPMDKLVLDLINECIDNGTSKSKIQSMFNRYDVSPKARQRLLEKYHKLYNSNEINVEKLEANNITKDVFTFLGMDLSQTKLDI